MGLRGKGVVMNAACFSIFFIVLISFVSEARRHGDGAGGGGGGGLTSSKLLNSSFVTLARHRHGGGSKSAKSFNVKNYGAAANGNTDDSKAFQKAWNDACGSAGKSTVLIPSGTYMVVSARFDGPCKGSILFLLQGVVKAPTTPALFFGTDWVLFNRVDRLEIKGGGTFDGQGASAWSYGGCSKNHGCNNKPLPISVRFNYITNSHIHHITSLDSKNAHYNLFACTNFNMSQITIKAPGDSPNTDGIHISYSKNIFISYSNISTGDDCVSMLTTSDGINLSQVRCGPGHGFSVGSLGGSPTGEHITGVTITNCTLVGTQNGLRIKSWERSQRCLAADFLFQDIIMQNVSNPIFIDQEYCPNPPCGQGNSGVQIRNVTYKNIRGTSGTKEAVKLICNSNLPCLDIKLVNINLSYSGKGGGPPTSNCSNVHGKSYGPQSPHACI